MELLNTLTNQSIKHALHRNFGIHTKISNVGLLRGEDRQSVMVRLSHKGKDHRIFVDITGHDLSDYQQLSEYIVNEVGKAL